MCKFPNTISEALTAVLLKIQVFWNVVWYTVIGILWVKQFKNSWTGVVPYASGSNFSKSLGLS
jgi:hypothetical protein